VLELHGIAKRLGSFGMSGVSLTLGESEYFVLLGPSGVGKTVLVEIIAGLMRPDAGRVLWQGRDITFDHPEKRRFALVYQDHALFPHLTVAQNVAYGLRATGAARETMISRPSAIAEMLGIEDIMGRLPATLSGGEQQRVTLARALAIKPRLLLLDEPLSALDTGNRARLQKELRRINKELGIPVFHVTHDPEEAMAVGDRLGVMLDGRIRQVASVEEMFRRPSDPDVARFLGMMNVLPVAAVNGDTCLVRGVEIRVNAPSRCASHVWIRPEEIMVSSQPLHDGDRNQLKGRITEWRHRNPLMSVCVSLTDPRVPEHLELTCLITHASFRKVGIKVGSSVHIAFRKSAVHCF